MFGHHFESPLPVLCTFPRCFSLSFLLQLRQEAEQLSIELHTKVETCQRLEKEIKQIKDSHSADRNLIHDDMEKVKRELRHEKRKSMNLGDKLGDDNLGKAIDGKPTSHKSTRVIQPPLGYTLISPFYPALPTLPLT